MDLVEKELCKYYVQRYPSDKPVKKTYIVLQLFLKNERKKPSIHQMMLTILSVSNFIMKEMPWQISGARDHDLTMIVNGSFHDCS